jgi:hypothetical protein
MLVDMQDLSGIQDDFKTSKDKCFEYVSVVSSILIWLCLH